MKNVIKDFTRPNALDKLDSEINKGNAVLLVERRDRSMVRHGLDKVIATTIFMDMKFSITEIV